MKNTFKFFGIITFAVIIGFVFWGCGRQDVITSWIIDPGPYPDPTLTGTVIITGTAQVGETLTAYTGSLGGTGTISYLWERYQWERDQWGDSIPIGTNKSTYNVQIGDVDSSISVTVTRAGYSGSVVSGVTAIVVSLPDVSIPDVSLPELTVTMVQIPAGTFRMGISGSDSDVKYRTENNGYVTLTGFSMGKYEVTQEQWTRVMGSNPSLYSSNPAAGEVQERRPVERVSWYDTLVFCNKLSMMKGLTPAYSINGSTNPDVWGTMPYREFSSEENDWTTIGDTLTWDKVKVVSDSNGYRLPTEAQWEYACRAGTTTDWYSGDWYSGNFERELVKYAWCDWASTINLMKHHEVGKKLPNAYGLYDMHGNVSEWCWDWYDLYDNAGGSSNPTGAASGSSRVHRGGSWDTDALYVSSAYRNNLPPYARWYALGFRVVRPLD